MTAELFWFITLMSAPVVYVVVVCSKVDCDRWRKRKREDGQSSSAKWIPAAAFGFVVGWGMMKLSGYDGAAFTGILCAAIGVWVARVE